MMEIFGWRGKGNPAFGEGSQIKMSPWKTLGGGGGGRFDSLREHGDSEEKRERVAADV